MTHHSADNDTTLAGGERVLATGGAGFIGSNLVKALVESGCEVTVLDNLSSGYRSNLAPFPGIRLVEADTRDADAVDTAIHSARVVFHLAASVGNKRSIEDPISDAETNVLGTLRILEGARRHNVR
jgi:UDP-glucose 4-epimerase